MGYFSAIKPDTVICAAIDNNPASITEVDSALKSMASKAFNVFDFFITLIVILIDGVQMLPIAVENVRYQGFKQGFYFSRIKKKAKTVDTSLY